MPYRVLILAGTILVLGVLFIWLVYVPKTEEIANAFTAKVWTLHVAEPEPDFVGFRVGRQSVRDCRSIAQGKPGCNSPSCTRSNSKNNSEGGTKLDIDMIVVGSHGRGVMYQLLVGSVSEGVIRKSKCPIFVVPTHERT